jgi:hypothetical protein
LGLIVFLEVTISEMLEILNALPQTIFKDMGTPISGLAVEIGPDPGNWTLNIAQDQNPRTGL